MNPERARFDFAHGQPVSAAELAEVERLVSQAILANHEVKAELMNQDDALKAGAMALFGEKYGDVVRVLSMGDVSIELCGGTMWPHWRHRPVQSGQRRRRGRWRAPD